MASPTKRVCRGGKRYCFCCSNFAGKIVEGRVVKLHRLPADTRLRRVWARRLRLMRADFSKVKDPRVCSEHFVQRRGPRPGDDVPSVFQQRIFKTSTLTEVGQLRANSMQQIDTPVVTETSPDIDESEEQHSADQGQLSLPAFSHVLHDYCGPVDTATIFKSTHQCVSCQTDVRHVDAAVQTDPMVVTNMLFRGKSKGTQTADLDQWTPLRYEHIASSDAAVDLYTGIKSRDSMMAMFNELPAVEDSAGGSAGRRSALRPVDQFLMTLMRIRLGLVVADLAFRFAVSTATASRYINKWIDHLYVQLSFLIYWPTRGQINTTMPADFADAFPKTRVVIGCAELWAETPKSLADQSVMVSLHKTDMAWKALVGITPNGVVSFVSDLCPGSMSDKHIVEKSKLLDLCERGDAIVGDEDFLISDLTTPRGIELIIPPKKKKAKQMSSEDTALTRGVANVKIHVQRHMQRLKNFRVLQNLTGPMKADVSKIWKICNYLTALMPPLHPHDKDDANDSVLDIDD